MLGRKVFFIKKKTAESFGVYQQNLDKPSGHLKAFVLLIVSLLYPNVFY